MKSSVFFFIFSIAIFWLFILFRSIYTVPKRELATSYGSKLRNSVVHLKKNICDFSTKKNSYETTENLSYPICRWKMKKKLIRWSRLSDMQIYSHWHAIVCAEWKKNSHFQVIKNAELFQNDRILTWTDDSAAQITSCERGLMNDGLLADCFPCLNIRDMRFVLVRSAP